MMVNGGAVCALLLSGCAMGRKWFQMDSNSRMPSAGFELRAQRDTPAENSRVQESTSDTGSIRPARLAEDKPRGLLPDWLKFGSRHEPIPLPTTVATDGHDGEQLSTGPREDFD